jgi:hypothetical protein
VIVVGDPSGAAAGTVAEESCFGALKRLGLPAFPAPSNSIDPRLRAVETLLGRQVNGGPMLAINRRGAPWLVRAMSGGYRYKKHKDGGLRAVPEKFDREGFSHVCFVAGTKVATPWGSRAIETLCVGDTVSTPLGNRRVTATGHRMMRTVECLFSNNARIRCTPDHPFWTNQGWIPAAQLSPTDVCHTQPEFENDEDSIQFSNLTASVIIGAEDITTTPKPANGFIGWCGSIISEQFHQVTTFTTRTTTRATTTLKTWNAYLKANTIDATCYVLAVSRNRSNPSSSPAMPRPASAKPIPNGPARSAGQQALPRPLGSLRRLPKAGPAPIAATATGPGPACAKEGSAHPLASPRPDENPELTTNKGYASNAEARLPRTNTPRSNVVRLIALESSPPANVYNITVDDAHCYYANGILVANCDCLQYVALVVHGGLVHEFARRLVPRKRMDKMPVTAAGWT